MVIIIQHMRRFRTTILVDGNRPLEYRYRPVRESLKASWDGLQEYGYTRRGPAHEPRRAGQHRMAFSTA